MSWINEEADKDQRRRNEESRREKLLENSNLWGLLTAQLRDDVTEINGHMYWQQKLRGIPLRVELTEQGWRVSKSNYPAAWVAIQNHGAYLMITRGFTQNPLSQNYSPTERLEIDTTGNVVFLTAGELNLGVPEEAVRYILQPIMDSLKATD